MRTLIAVAVLGWLLGVGWRALELPISEDVLWGLLMSGAALWGWATWREHHPRRLR